MTIKRHLPSLLTCLNLACGCVAVKCAFSNQPEWAAYLVFGAAFLDLLDGLLARSLNAFSEFGKQLDSLADMVSFGLVPGAVMYKIFIDHSGFFSDSDPNFFMKVFQYYPFLITIFSALRLAKFNIDVRQSESFIGLAVPANAMFFVSWPLIMHFGPGNFAAVLTNPYIMLVLIALQSYLMVAEIRMFSFKMKSLSWKGNELRYIFLLVSALLLCIFLYGAIPLIVFFYVLLSTITSKLNPR